MVEKMIPKKRNGIYYKNDKEYVSVTKVLGETLDKPALFHWGCKLATQFALADPTLTDKEVKQKVMAYTRETQERGKYIHSLAERMPDVGSHEVMPAHLAYFAALQRWWSKNNPEVIATEVEVFSERLGVAGRLDHILKINGLNCVLDWKIGKAIYPEVGLQLAFYKEALEEQEIITIDRKVVVLLTAQGEFVEKDTNDSIESFENVLKVWKWIKGRE